MTDTHSPAATGATPEPRTALAPLARLAGVVRQPVYVVIALVAGLALGLRLYQLSRPGFLFGVSEYDDGVFFGNALRLAGGAVPYRDFASVEPPGSTLLIAPVALLAKAWGTGTALAIARVLTVCADVACVVLLGLLVRHRGVLAVVVACGVYAVFPGAIVAAHTFMLEPWLNVFCLAGAVLVFDRDRLAGSSWRLAQGGAAFGLAGTIKIWAFVPALVIGLLCLPRPRRAVAYAAGAVAGVMVPVLPFLILAPRALVQSVLVGELTRAGKGHGPALPRLAGLAGVSANLTVHATTVALTGIVALVVVAYAAACIATRRPPAPLDWYALLGAAAVTVMFVWPSEFYPHYAAFAAPFLALIIALPLGTLAGHRWPAAPAGLGRWPARAVAVAVAAAIGLMAVNQFSTAARLPPQPDQAAVVGRLIPRGACVLSDTVSRTINADRFSSNVPGCPLMVDSFGALIALTKGENMSASPQLLGTVTQAWHVAFAHAQYVWLDGDTSGRIPWTLALHAYFTSHFKLIGLSHYKGTRQIPPGGIYVRDDLATTRGAPPG
jgi:hypothetical protein